MKCLKLIAYAVLGVSGLSWAAGAWAHDLFWTTADPMPQTVSSQGPTLRDLSPVQVYAAPQVSVDPPEELPDIDPAASDAAGGVPVKKIEPRESAGDHAPIDAIVPVVNLSALDPSLISIFNERGTGLLPVWALSRFRSNARWPGGLQAGVFNRHTSWLSSLPSRNGWSMGSENWRYTDSKGVGFTLGNEWSSAPAWSNPIRMGGIRVSRSSNGNATKPGADPWQYSLMVGVLDYSPDSTDQGDLVYGPAAGTTAVQYVLSPALTLDSQVEWAPDLLTTGLGAEYDTQRWGAWSVGVAKANQSLVQGWRYQAGYRIVLADTVQLSWVGAQRSGGFSDLARYQNFAVDLGQSSNRWSATVPLGRWGNLTGGYENVHTGAGELQQSFGLTQQFWYSPNLSIALKADREIQSGDYDVGVRFSVPIR